MNALLSIKPRYVRKIIEGTKKYEFRKVIFKHDIDQVWIYESAPTQKIIGQFALGQIHSDTPESLWNMLGENAGINEKDFFLYFNGKEKGYALEIKDLTVFDEPIDPREQLPDFRPPQSFCYLEAVLPEISHINA